MKDNKTAKNQNIIYEGIVETFVNNPFSFMFGAHFLQSILRQPEQGENPEFEEWMQTNSELPDAVEQMHQAMGSKKLSPDEIRKKGFDFVGEEEKEAMAKAMEDLPDSIKAQFEGAMSEKAAKAYGNFQDSAKAALKITNGVTESLRKDLESITSTLEGSPSESLFPKEFSDKIIAKLDKELKVYQKAIVQKIVVFEKAVQEKISKSKDNRLAGKLNLGEFSLDEIIKEEEESSSKESAKKTLDMANDALVEYGAKLEKGVVQFTKALEKLKNSLGAGSMGIEPDQALKWADSVGAISKSWLAEIEKIIFEVSEQIESTLEKAISEPKKEMNESFRRKTFYESFGDFS